MYVIPLKLYSNVSDTTTNVVNVVGACIDLPTVTDRIQADARSRSRRRSPAAVTAASCSSHRLLFFARRQCVKHLLPLTPVKIKRVSVS